VSAIHRTAATLRFFGDLDPDEISDALGGKPTVGVRAGGTWINKGGREIVARRGTWRLETERRSPGDLDAQIEELFAGLTKDLDVWRALTGRFQADIFCGVFMAAGNEGLELTPSTLFSVGARGLTLGLDIYGSEIPD
jgi:uncharacterized protein DUF4279